MITDKDIEKLQETFLTKDEFNKGFNSLDGRVVTLEEKVDGIVYELGDLKVEVAEIKETLIDMNEQLNTKMDRFLGNFDVLKTESNVCTVVQKRHTDQIEDLAAHTGFALT